ncbi:THO complex subunit 6 [Tanacetum coccineum]
MSLSKTSLKVGLRKIWPLLWLTGFEISPNTFVSASIFSTKYASLRLAKVAKPEVPSFLQLIHLLLHHLWTYLNVAKPNSLLHGHDGPAYEVKFYGDGEDSLFGGDDGRIRRWTWMDVMEAKQDGFSKSGDLKAHLDMANPEHKSLGALSPIPETNAMAVDGGSGFAAAGDSYAYCWDVYRTSLDYDGERVVYGSTVPVLDGEELTMRLLTNKKGWGVSSGFMVRGSFDVVRGVDRGVSFYGGTGEASLLRLLMFF